MALSAGTRLGPYEILSALGSGGMGEVYRARDTNLNRDVAIKILPDLFTNDPERLARFQREARVLASLNHPHIAAVYGLEQADGVTAIVLELVDGETLADLLVRGPLAASDALPIARQIAEALEAAHEKGVVHRDVKPANIKVRPDGAVKVLDFGLAKASAGDGAGPDLTPISKPPQLERNARPLPFLETAFNKTQAKISPDGRWIAYTSNESGGDEVYVQSFPVAGSKRQVSTSGGVQPRWRADGRELYYLASDQRLMTVPVKSGVTFDAGAPAPLFRTRLVAQGGQSVGLPTSYDVSPDGQRFLINVRPDDLGPPVTVVLNWMSSSKK